MKSFLEFLMAFPFYYLYHPNSSPMRFVAGEFLYFTNEEIGMSTCLPESTVASGL